MILRAENESLYSTTVEVAKFIGIEPTVVNLEIQKVINELVSVGEKTESFFIATNGGYFISVDGLRLLPFATKIRIHLEKLLKESEAPKASESVEVEIVSTTEEVKHTYTPVPVVEYQPINVMEELKNETKMSVGAEDFASVFAKGVFERKSKSEHVEKSLASLEKKYSKFIKDINEIQEKAEKYDCINKQLELLGSELGIVQEVRANEYNIKQSATLIGSGVLVDVSYRSIEVQGDKISLMYEYCDDEEETFIDIHSKGSSVNTKESILYNKIAIFLDKYNGINKTYESSDYIEVRSLDGNISFSIAVGEFVEYQNGDRIEVATPEGLEVLKARYEEALNKVNEVLSNGR